MLKATRAAPVPFIKDSERGWLRGLIFSMAQCPA